MSEKFIARQRMEIKDKERRVEIAAMLFAEGYAVRPVEVKLASGRCTKKYYVEYWKEEA